MSIQLANTSGEIVGEGYNNDQIEFFLGVAPQSVQFGGKRVTVVKGRPRWFVSKKAQAYVDSLSAILMTTGPRVPHEGSVCLVCLTFHMRKPKRLKPFALPIVRPDVDNLAKPVLDVLTKRNFWRDDSQILSLVLTKVYSDNPGILVRINY